jgi:hypothetical protein
VRSDNDLFTYGYRFKPWRGPSIAEGKEILSYLDEVIDEDDLHRHIRYRHRVTDARWSTQDGDPPTAAEIEAFSREHLAGYKRPRHVRTVGGAVAQPEREGAQDRAARAVQRPGRGRRASGLTRREN